MTRAAIAQTCRPARGVSPAQAAPAASPPPRCGDQVIDEGESCDDGGERNGDGCDAACTLETFELKRAREQVASDGAAAGSRDTFLFTIDEHATVRVFVQDDQEACGDRATVRLLSDGGQPLARGADAPDGRCAFWEGPVAGGSYALAVEAPAGGALGAYTLDFQLTTPVTGGGTFHGAFVPAGDDAYRLDLPSAAPVRLETSDGAGACPGDTLLAVYPLDAQGERLDALQEHDDQGFDACSLIDAPLPAGAYDVVVSGFGEIGIDACTLSVGVTCNGGHEACNGEDDDCDGRVDEGSDGQPLSFAGPGGIEAPCVSGNLWPGFVMGTDGEGPDEQPTRVVMVPPFAMGRTEVTVAQYRACRDAGVCSAPGNAPGCNGDVADRGDHPVNCVTWAQASAFARWVGGRLPSEAEWEFVASGGGDAYPWGDEPWSCDRAVIAAGAGGANPGCGLGHTAPVCSKPTGSTTHGICDLMGNVSEWVADEWVPYPRAPTDGSPATDLCGDCGRPLRGGDWYATVGPPDAWTAHTRRQGPDGTATNRLGFRVAWSVEALIDWVPIPAGTFRMGGRDVTVQCGKKCLALLRQHFFGRSSACGCAPRRIRTG